MLILIIDGWSISCDIDFRWMFLERTDSRLTLVQVMAWCRQAITWANVDPNLCQHMASLDHNEFKYLGIMLCIETRFPNTIIQT